MNTLRILMVEADDADARFLREALGEIEEGQYWEQWLALDLLQAAMLDEALALLRSESIDVILLALDLPDHSPFETFIALQEQAPHVPVVLLAARGDEPLCLRLLREGAQDFVFKEELDCAPLAHALRASVERHRLLHAARSAGHFDLLTGLPNRAGFFVFADRDRRLAQAFEKKLILVVAEPKRLAGIEQSWCAQRHDLAVLEAADRLRALLGPLDLLARLTPSQFGILTLNTTVEPLRLACSAAHILIGRATLDPTRPASLEMLIEQAERELALHRAPLAHAMRQ